MFSLVQLCEQQIYVRRKQFRSFQFVFEITRTFTVHLKLYLKVIYKDNISLRRFKNCCITSLRLGLYKQDVRFQTEL